MENTPSKKRKSIRLGEFDYSLPGAYFITIVTHGRDCLFGDIQNDEMVLNDFGKVVVDEWQKTPIIRPNVGLGAFIVMPNHFHGIIHILEGQIFPNTVEAYCNTPLPSPQNSEISHKGLHSPSQTVGSIVRGFKGAVTKRINDLRGTPGTAVWQRNYYEHIVRSDEDYLRIEKYIYDNPLNWHKDAEYPLQTR